MKSAGRVLLFGGGKVHDHRACCRVLSGYLEKMKFLGFDYSAGDYDVFKSVNIKKYDAAVIYHTGGDLNIGQKRGLVEWCAAGGGVVGIHGAADSFKSSPEYLAMLGGAFRTHPFKREYTVSLNDESHPAMKHIKGYAAQHWEKWPVFEFQVEDEQYLVEYDCRNTVLASAIFRGRAWPAAWAKSWGKGKVFYLALGHDEKACRDPFFKNIFRGGLEWVLDPGREPEKDCGRFKI